MQNQTPSIDFEFETRKRSAPSINLTALMDIAFILVIFIVLGANFHRLRDLEVTLPNADAAHTPSHESLVVTIQAQGQVGIQGEKVDIENVRATLQKYRSKFETVLLMADEKAAVEHAVKVIGFAQGLGYKSVGIATQGANQGSKK